MQKLNLKTALQPLTPALPDPYGFAEEIAASIRFIEKNPNAGPRDIPRNMLYLWCVPQDDIRDTTARLEELAVTASTLSSFIVFAHLYLRHYRLKDFGDFDNFVHAYGRFQTLLNRIISIRSKGLMHILDNGINIFNLNNLDGIIDAINPNRTERFYPDLL